MRVDWKLRVDFVSLPVVRVDCFMTREKGWEPLVYKHVMSVICTVANLCHVRQTATALLKQMMSLWCLLEPAETHPAFHCLMQQDLWWLQAQY